ncbi:MAG TPA: hypothetical protein VM658_04315 [bacterium]|nr:hypothetical protein [bacterium]
MKVTDEKIKRLVLQSARKRPRGECPSEECLAVFTEGKMTEPDKESVLGHLARCGHCRESVYVLRHVLAEGPREREFKAPLLLLERAGRLDPARKSLMEVVVRFVKGAAEVVRMSADVIGGMAPALESVRGEEGRVVSDTLITFSKAFPPYLAEVDVEKTRPDRGEISIKFTDETTNQPALGIRVSLFNNGLELESAMTEDGHAVFENLKFGQYRLEITKVGEPVGRITLAMKGEGQ